MSEFWLEDPSTLIKDGKYKDIIPNQYMNRVEQMNAITRLCLYFIILIFVFKRDYTWLYIPLLIIIFVVVLYNISIYDTKEKEKEQLRKRAIYNENFESDNEIENYKNDTKYEIQSGSYDSNGDLVFDKERDVYDNLYEKNDLFYSLDELATYDKNTCRRPTENNPFMNSTLAEYNTENEIKACNVDDEEIIGEINENFNKNLYMDIDDLFDIKNSQRQFYTIPSPAIPNDQTEFANWLYKTPETCKVDQEHCLRYEDLRFNRHL